MRSKSNRPNICPYNWIKRRRIMKRYVRSLGCLAAFALVVAAPVHAQQSKASGKQTMVEGVGAMEVTRVTASVEAMDVKNRIVTLKGPRGNMFAVLVGPAVKNLAQIKAGDTLEMDYYESVAVEVKKTAGAPSLTETDVAAKAAPGEKPGALVLRRVRIVTNVLGVNTESQSVLVRGPLGHVTEVKIRDSVVVADLKAGGQIDLTYVEGMAVAVKTGNFTK
jgi:hypothetical protein